MRQCIRARPSWPPTPSGRSPARSCATAATAWSSRPEMPTRSAPESACWCAIPSCARGWVMRPARTSRPTRPTPGQRGSAAPWLQRAGVACYVEYSRRRAYLRAVNCNPPPLQLGGQLVRNDMGYLTLTRLITLLSALLIALAVPAIANASGNDVIRDCAQDGDLDKEYSDEELQDAEENLPSDVDSYSNCRDVIRAAQTGGRGSKDGVGSGSGSGGTTSGGTGGGSGGTGNESALDPNGSPKATPEDSNELDIREDAARSGTAPATDSELLGGADAGDDDS